MPTLATELAYCAREQTLVTLYTSSSSFDGTIVEVDEDAVVMQAATGKRIVVRLEAIEALTHR